MLYRRNMHRQSRLILHCGNDRTSLIWSNRNPPPWRSALRPARSRSRSETTYRSARWTRACISFQKKCSAFMARIGVSGSPCSTASPLQKCARWRSISPASGAPDVSSPDLPPRDHHGHVSPIAINLPHTTFRMKRMSRGTTILQHKPDGKAQDLGRGRLPSTSHRFVFCRPAISLP